MSSSRCSVCGAPATHSEEVISGEIQEFCNVHGPLHSEINPDRPIVECKICKKNLVTEISCENPSIYVIAQTIRDHDTVFHNIRYSYKKPEVFPKNE